MLNNIGKFFKLLIVRIKPMRIRGECMEKRPVKKKWYRQLIQLIVVALIVTSIPLNGLAETAPPFTPSPNSEQTPEVEKKEEKELPAPHPDQLKKDKAKAQASPTEIVEERTET